MIRLLAADKTPIRMIPGAQKVRLDYYPRFGFVSPQSLLNRQSLRDRSGLPDGGAAPVFGIEIEYTNGSLQVRSQENVKLQSLNSNEWQLQASGLDFVVDWKENQDKTLPKIEDVSTASARTRGLLIICSVLLLLMTTLIFVSPEEELETKAQENLAPVVLRSEVPPPPVVTPPRKTAEDAQAKAKRALTQQLGFLGTIGTKNPSRVKGGLPTDAPQVTDGAGAGGDAGSGGELLAGMGRGLHKTTVGNSGVTGLGGLGTKGAGGGVGGYGDTSFGGAGGQTLSAVPMERDASVDDGLDRSQIQATIMRYLSQVRACYEEGLKRNQALIGQVTMSFEISGQGAVNFARVARSSLNDRPVEQCISGKMLYWKFPLPRNGKSVGVSYPFMLRPIRS